MNTLAWDDDNSSDDGVKWGYAIAGGIAIAFAIVIQFAFGELDGDAVESLPPLIQFPYALAGKLGLTIPLVGFGMGLIIFDLNKHQSKRAPIATTRPATTRRGRAELQTDDDLEVGEPIAEELATPAPIPAGKKIPAGPAHRPGPGTPSAPQVDAGGGMVLSSAKYLNNGTANPGNFRKGRTHHTKTDDE